MRIRRRASRLLGSTSTTTAPLLLDVAPPFDYSTPPTIVPHLSSFSALESHGEGSFSSPMTTSRELCELSRSPWDLIAELSLSDPQEEDDLMEKYSVHVSNRASWLLSATMPATSIKKNKNLPAACWGSTQLQPKGVKKDPLNKEMEGKTKKRAKVNKVEWQDGEAEVWSCKKNDGNGSQANRGDNKRKIPWKRWRKPMKVMSLKSLM